MTTDRPHAAFSLGLGVVSALAAVGIAQDEEGWLIWLGFAFGGGFAGILLLAIGLRALGKSEWLGVGGRATYMLFGMAFVALVSTRGMGPLAFPTLLAFSSGVAIGTAIGAPLMGGRSESDQ